MDSAFQFVNCPTGPVNSRSQQHQMSPGSEQSLCQVSEAPCGWVMSLFFLVQIRSNPRDCKDKWCVQTISQRSGCETGSTIPTASHASVSMRSLVITSSGLQIYIGGKRPSHWRGRKPAGRAGQLADWDHVKATISSVHRRAVPR